MAALYLALYTGRLLLGPIFGHSATTEDGSSGCPIFREFQRRWIVVGLHRGELKGGDKIYANVATHMSVVCDVFMGESYDGHGT